MASPKVTGGRCATCWACWIFIGGGYLLGRHALLLAELNLPAPIVLALKGGLLCAFGTALGAMPVLVVKTMPARLSDALLGFGAGVMLSATAFSLIMPALSAAGDLGLLEVRRGVPGQFRPGGRRDGAVHPRPADAGRPSRLRGRATVRWHSPRILLFVTAIVLHNIPEGMAVGVSAGAGLDEANGLALGIALQDVPEGLVVALVLAGVGYVAFQGDAGRCRVGPGRAAVRGALRLAGRPLRAAPALGLAAAAGAMLFVVTHEIIPESHRRDMPPRLRWAWCSASA